MITRERASLFLDSVVGSSDWRGTVATCERFERLPCTSVPLRLRGRVSEDILGERDNWRELVRDRVPLAEGGLMSGKGEALVSVDSDFR